MRVSLLQYTPEPEMTVAIASRLCYSPVGIEELQRKWTRREALKLIDKIMALGHFSVLEHASFTFGVEGISRAASHQIVRHRLASYSQQSQRYVKARSTFDYVLPESIRQHKELRRSFLAFMEDAGKLYRTFVESGVPPEDARFVLPNAAATKIVITMNVRELHHFFSLRCCLRAQWEIRGVAEEMLGLARRAAPALFALAGPGCLRGKCPEKEMTCGRTSDVRKAYARWKGRRKRPGLDHEKKT